MQTQKQHEYRDQSYWADGPRFGNVGETRDAEGRDGNGNDAVNLYPQSQQQRERASSQPPRPIAEYSQFIGVTTKPSSTGHPPSRSPSLSPAIRFTQAPPVSTSPSSGFHNPWVAQQSRSRIPSFGRTTSQPGGSGDNSGTGTGVSGVLGLFPHAIPVPTRSSSFSAPSGSSASQSYLSSVRDNLRFTSTFEDDESEALSDNSYSFDDPGVNPNVNIGANGGGGHRLYPQAQYGTDTARSRSQSLLVPPSPASLEFGNNWGVTPSGSTTATARPSFSSSDFLTPAAPTAIPGRSRTQTTDISNISPFRRDIHQILMGDSSAVGSHSVGVSHYGRQGVGLGTLGPPGAPSVLSPSGHRDDPSLGGTSGTASRRHSMSIYHPRRDIHVGFQTSSLSSAFEDAASSSSTAALTPLFRSNVLSDDELASGLGGGGGGSSGFGGITTGLQNLTMSASAPGHAGMQSQPSSLPNFTHSRAGGLLGSPEHSRFLPGASPGGGSGARGLSPHRPSISPALSRTTTSTSATHLDSGSDRAASVSPRNDVVAGSNYGIGGLGGVGSTNAMGMSIGMTHNPYGRFTSTEVDFGGLSPPSGTGPGALGVSTGGPGAGRYLPNILPPPPSLSMYPGVSDNRAGAGLFAHGQTQQPTSPISAGFGPTRFGHAHSSSLGHMRGIPSINATMGVGSGGPQLHMGMGGGGGGGGGNGPTSPHSPISDELSELGRGMPLHSVPSSYQLFIVEFKAGRTDLFYTADRSGDIRLGDLVIVEADRGKDLGKIINDTITTNDVESYQRAQQVQAQQMEQQFGGDAGASGPAGSTSKREINPKRIYGKAGAHETQLLTQKLQDEMKALQLCQTKVRAKKLPMEVVDAEYQWDRRKLTFYFVAEKRIDFRELVRELFRLYKTRIWMASLQAPPEPGTY